MQKLKLSRLLFLSLLAGFIFFVFFYWGMKLLDYIVWEKSAYERVMRNKDEEITAFKHSIDRINQRLDKDDQKNEYFNTTLNTAFDAINNRIEQVEKKSDYGIIQNLPSNEFIGIMSDQVSIFRGEGFSIDLLMTNINNKPVTIAQPDHCKSKEQWVTNNPLVKLQGSVCLDSMPTDTEADHLILKPNQAYKTKVAFDIEQQAFGLGKIEFKIGFKEDSQAIINWSKPIEVSFRQNASPVVRIEAGVIKDNVIKVSKGEAFSSFVKIPLRITNISNVAQTIGIAYCGSKRIDNIKTDSQNVYLMQYSYEYCPEEDKKVVLSPGQVFEQTDNIGLNNKKQDVEGVQTFRLGLDMVGFDTAWSEPVKVIVKQN